MHLLLHQNSQKITQPLKSEWWKIQILLGGDFFIIYNGNLATINHISIENSSNNSE
jgi:hypothetical protein